MISPFPFSFVGVLYEAEFSLYCVPQESSGVFFPFPLLVGWECAQDTFFFNGSYSKRG